MYYFLTFLYVWKVLQLNIGVKEKNDNRKLERAACMSVGLFTVSLLFSVLGRYYFISDSEKLEFGVLFSGVTTSILALELSPNSLFQCFQNCLLSILPEA